ncbi:hypothetical protein Uis1B_1316 [Bifidobacterium margollesii]|uniref:Uncharacterized protein n=1 Tax=Bifidobacterium margollesii TaxID=2020964 RepID=A0A2N5J9F4_9BIFI|nr:hypothetical protein [Bifidobacterium margollesii]PLS30842.1 hypothetical protein Uis1B_1316 [Bifidobacterium margollesii]
MINEDTGASAGAGWRRIVTTAMLLPVFLGLFLGLAACGQTSTGDGQSADGGEPAFSGPYAAEFKRTYEQAPTDLARNILKDGRITQAEVQEIYDAYNTCLEPYGLQASWSMDQGETVGQYRGALSDEKELKIMDDCHTKTYAGIVSSLYATMNRNPDNIDQETLARKTYQCYAKYDLLPSTISEDEYMSTMNTVNLTDNSRFEANQRRWHEFFGEYMSTTYDGKPNPNYRYDGESEKGRQFWACNQDPLHQ